MSEKEANLVRVASERAVVAGVPDVVPVPVNLCGVVDSRTVVLAVDYSVSIDVRIARVAVSITIHIFLWGAGDIEI